MLSLSKNQKCRKFSRFTADTDLFPLLSDSFRLFFAFFRFFRIFIRPLFLPFSAQGGGAWVSPMSSRVPRPLSVSSLPRKGPLSPRRRQNGTKKR